MKGSGAGRKRDYIYIHTYVRTYVRMHNMRQNEEGTNASGKGFG